MRTHKLNERVFLFMDDGHHHENVVVIWTHSGPVVVDSFRFPSQFQAVEEHMRERGYARPLAQIFTHWHPNHIMGNRNLAETRVLAHRLTWEFMLGGRLAGQLGQEELLWVRGGGLPGPEDGKIFEKELNLTIGGMGLRLLHVAGHTADSTIVHIPEYRLVIAGDNLVGPEVEFFFPSGPTRKRTPQLDALALVYRRIRLLVPKIVVPGHGWVLPPEEMLSLNEHRLKSVLRRSAEIAQRLLAWSESGGPEGFNEYLIKTWLSQANACVTMDEQEALKESVGRVLNQLGEAFAHGVMRE
ncbi:metallo-beta-lactamase superfamily protein [Peptococcaceae bacterium CEB3]|nr:metallo-beta-lactamase superfamily protein [Peptococcaceae bacterium CEB3]